jgi:ABC-2 type transport system permease protein
MNNFEDMLWIETRKVLSSKMPLFTLVGCLFFPFGIGFLIFVAKNPSISQKLGLIGAKANLMAYTATDWPAYLGFFGLIIAAGGFILFVLVISWVFGREFVDGTLKDLLAVPVPRGGILLAKFIIVAAWCLVLTLVIYLAGLLMGALLHLPGGTGEIMAQGGVRVLITACLTIVVVMPFAFFASIGRGYLLPIGMAILALMMANLVAVTGRAEYFPWGVPGLFAQDKTILTAASYWIVILTGLAGMFATYVWWKYADQSR